MSTPNPTHIDVIAHALADAADDGCFDNPPCCDEPPCSDACGTDLDEWHSGEEDREHWTKLARASVSKLTDAGYSIMPSGDVELLRSIRWTVNGSAPMDLKDEYADGFNAAMRNIHRILHPAAAAEGDSNG